MTATWVTKSKRHMLLGIGGLALLVTVAGAGGVAAATGGTQAPAPKATTTPAPTPTVTEVTRISDTTPLVKPTPEPPKRQPLKPFGPISADPVRVHTGDGDCLNVRPQPGTLFKTDPRACVPEGFLLWLYGPEQQVDGETWRYALGEGWVATRYVKPAPAPNTPTMSGFSSVIVSQSDGIDATAATVGRDGNVLDTLTSAYQQQSKSGPSYRVSPSGAYVAYAQEENYVPTLTVIRRSDRVTAKYPGAWLALWGPGDRLLLRLSRTCPNSCDWKTAWLDPAEGVIHPFEHLPNEWNNLAWMPDGRSFITVTLTRSVLRVSLDGSTQTIVKELGEGIYLGEATVSPDGTKLLSGATIGAIRVLDLRTGQLSEIQRATQLPGGGRCGGATGRLSAWLDNSTAIWHESYAEKGNNGITIAALGSTARRVFPFFSIQGLQVVAPGLVSFTTYEYPGNDGGFLLTWLLDIKTGDARPITVGGDPIWLPAR